MSLRVLVVEDNRRLAALICDELNQRGFASDRSNSDPAGHLEFDRVVLRTPEGAILHGRVANVSADSFEDERTGQRYFRIQVEVPPGELAKIRQFREDGGLRPGLPAEVMVPMRKRSALTYLLEPPAQSLWRAGREH